MTSKKSNGEDTNSETLNSEETTNVTTDTNNSNDFGPLDGANNILAAWQGLYWLFNARVDRFDVTPDGVVAVGLRVDPQYDVDKIVHDISTRGDKSVERRLDLLPAYFYINGDTPDPFADSNAMTQFMAQYFRGSGEAEGRSPDYVKAAIAAYKKEHGLAVRRGRPPRTIKVEALSSIDPSVLANIDVAELEKLMETVRQSIESR
jgi:hypothetical protein